MKFKFFDEINSTNEYLRRHLRIEEFEVIVAKKQTDGKGRRERVWISNEGAALFSFAVSDNTELDEKITVFAGYIVYNVLKEYVESKEKLTFKWPNDIYYEDKKICGILCEKVRDYIIVGIGITHSIQEIIEKTVSNFEEQFYSLNRNWENILNVVNENSYLKDRKIIIKQNGKFLEKEYKFLRIDRRGNLSLIGKGDEDEMKFTSLEFKVI